MAPVVLQAVDASTAAIAAAGGTKSALSWPTILAFIAITLACMQGTLVLESSDPCRISYRKLSFLLGLELAEVIVIVVSEVFSYIQMQSALATRLQWLYWLAPCLIAISLIEVLNDVWFTLILASASRIRWLPFSSVGERKGSRSVIVELIPLLVTTALSAVLVGWRQRWWWVADSILAEASISAARAELALSNKVLAFCAGWGLFLNCSMTFLFVYVEKANDFKSLSNIWTMIVRKRKSEWTNTGVSEDYCRQFYFLKKCAEEQDLNSPIEPVLDSDQKEDWEATVSLHTDLSAPLHIRNAVFGLDEIEAYNEYLFSGFVNSNFDNSSFWRSYLLLCEHFSLIPFQVAVMVAVSRLYDKVDDATFSALKEIVDVVIVIAFVDLAIGLKVLLWGSGYHKGVRSSDIPDCTPKEN